MLILGSNSDADGAQPHARVALFGSGLVGGAIVRELVSADWRVAADFPFAWDAPDQQAAQLEAISAALAENTDNGTRLDIVWSAGRAGFGADAATLAREHATFELAVSVLSDVAAAHFTGRARFHLMSSAGGLFEGQTQVARTTLPKPLRPYGDAKLHQEAAVAALGAMASTHIYRPSSVYGYAPGARAGLVSMLLTNALEGRVTNVFGNPNTVRDYIFTDDIARFIANRISARGSGHSTIETLASGKPTSMIEMIEAVRRLTKRHVYLQYDPRPSNALHMSFIPDALPADLKITPLQVGLSKTYNRIRFPNSA